MQRTLSMSCWGTNKRLPFSELRFPVPGSRCPFASQVPTAWRGRASRRSTAVRSAPTATWADCRRRPPVSRVPDGSTATRRRRRATRSSASPGESSLPSPSLAPSLFLPFVSSLSVPVSHLLYLHSPPSYLDFPPSPHFALPSVPQSQPTLSLLSLPSSAVCPSPLSPCSLPSPCPTLLPSPFPYLSSPSLTLNNIIRFFFLVK